MRIAHAVGPPTRNPTTHAATCSRKNEFDHAPPKAPQNLLLPKNQQSGTGEGLTEEALGVDDKFDEEATMAAAAAAAAAMSLLPRRRAETPQFFLQSARPALLVAL